LPGTVIGDLSLTRTDRTGGCVVDAACGGREAGEPSLPAGRTDQGSLLTPTPNLRSRGRPELIDVESRRLANAPVVAASVRRGDEDLVHRVFSCNEMNLMMLEGGADRPGEKAARFRWVLAERNRRSRHCAARSLGDLIILTCDLIEPVAV